ncbi:MAG: hypothetical protein H6644_06795 [Caldilineaceae bacterium]|nr:hypothetical protein [Caldilineaceae bacterium]
MERLRRFSAHFDPYLLLLLALTTLVFTPLFAPGYFYAAHDGRHSVFYLAMFDASIRDGALWPRWAMHHIQGYGYPTFIIQAPLGFYVGELFVLLGAGYTLAAKLTWAVGFWASAWGMYALVHHWIGTDDAVTPGTGRVGLDRARLAALVAGLLYVFIPYHLVGIYVRAALNDTLLFAWTPWVLLAFDRLIVGGGRPGWTRRLAVAALLLAGTLLTHTFALISFTPLLISFVLFRLAHCWLQETPRGWRSLLTRAGLALAGGVGALLLFAGFLLPLLSEGQNLQQQVYSTGTYDFRNHFVYFGQFFNPMWGFGYSDDPTGVNDGMSFQIGVMAALLLIIAIYQLWGPGMRRRGVMLYLLVVTVALLLFMTPWAQPIWDAVPALGIIQFPWRLLSLVALTGCALGGMAVANVLWQEADADLALGGVLVVSVLVILASADFIGAPLQPVEPWREDGRAVFRFEQEHPDMIAYTTDVKEPFTTSPMTADYAAADYFDVRGRTDKLTRMAVIEGTGEVVTQASAGSSGGGVVRMATPGVVRVHLFYFPGWQAYLDGAPVPLRLSDPHGLLELDVPAGEHRIDVRMESTPARRVGALIAWATFLTMLTLLVWPTRRRSTTRPTTPKP